MIPLFSAIHSLGKKILLTVTSVMQDITRVSKERSVFSVTVGKGQTGVRPQNKATTKDIFDSTLYFFLVVQDPHIPTIIFFRYSEYRTAERAEPRDEVPQS